MDFSMKWIFYEMIFYEMIFYEMNRHHRILSIKDRKKDMSQ